MLFRSMNGCDVAQLKAKGTLSVADGYPHSVMTKKYDFNISIGQVIGSYEQSCNSLGGSYIPGDQPACAMPALSDCNSGEVVVGFAGANAPICAPVFWNIADCGDGNVMTGINPDGTAQCKAIKPNPGCADPTKPSCKPFDCQKTPNDPACFAPATANVSNGDGGCGDGC